MKRIPLNQGLLFQLIKKAKPSLSKVILEANEIETIVIGLGSAGTRHAGLMHAYGTRVVGGIAPQRGGSRIHEVIPVYESIADCLLEHPNVAAASIWRHYSTAAIAAIEAMEAGIPVVVLISEGIPQRDVRDIITSAKKHGIILIGGNTPGMIFPPEGIKIGMLPDVFYPEECAEGTAGPKGVTILSRSGAILYHMSDALASVGIAQNAVLGVGGDAAIGSTFRTLVPLAMEHEHTDLVVVAGEIGGIQEELLAKDIKERPKLYPKPLIALISGSQAPEGKTMGHAGAIISPGAAFGTFESKREALTSAGITVVNSQFDLITEVKKRLGDRTYFQVSNYYGKMRELWDSPPAKPFWSTLITKVEPNSLLICGYPLKDLIGKISLLDAAHLLLKGEVPSPAKSQEHQKIAMEALRAPSPAVELFGNEDISKKVSKMLFVDHLIPSFKESGKVSRSALVAFALGRVVRYLAKIYGCERELEELGPGACFGWATTTALTGNPKKEPKFAMMIEAMAVACIDHGVTPPSAQATIIASSVRAEYEVALAVGVSAITDIHGGAGANAAKFFKACERLSCEKNISLEEAAHHVMSDFVKRGERIEGLGHRVHTNDPRRDSLWKGADQTGISGPCVKASKFVEDVFEKIRGLRLPINVDGVIGAIIADMGLDPTVAKAIFILGRIAGLSAHHFEEVASQPPMRQIVFSEALYKGSNLRNFTR